MVYDERDIRKAQALDIAQKMVVAARTAPKGKGVDVVECAVVDGDDLEALRPHHGGRRRGSRVRILPARRQLCAQKPLHGARGHARRSPGLGTRGHCGFATCGERTPGVPCEVNSVDVGIALGAAVSRAQAFGVDTRIMFSAGLAAQQLSLLGEGVGQVYAIPVSISSKSPFFDRRVGQLRSHPLQHVPENRAIIAPIAP